ncbi:hypothetical protein K9L67_04625 [Candidatus Woesearchaeota archaeon]|nr:hypothetical protein [Candidatus Woesearchaeota archaeon]MCF7901484.1 hypothetical protein [Candidatus Woesearchaeota archaeon]MCF8013183.1 hypothetical protein [Candidatus Woesearchaeota archaeon]
MKTTIIREDFRRDGLAANFLGDKYLIEFAINSFPNSIFNIGYPGICEEEKKMCSDILEHNKDSNAELAVVGHARPEHLELMSKIISPYQNVSANIWVPISDDFINQTMKTTPDNIKEYIKKLIGTWKTISSAPLDIAFADMFTGNNKDRAKNWAEEFLSEGIRRIIICDTKGLATPYETKEVFDFLSKYKNNLEFHAHNDNGLGIDKIMAAINKDIKYVGTSIYGAGERGSMIDPRSLKDFVMVNEVEFEKFEQLYRQQIGNPEEIIPKVFGENIIVTGSQWKLRNKNSSLKPYFGVTSNIELVEYMMNEQINQQTLSELKNNLLYSKRNIILSKEQLNDLRVLK